MNPIAPHITAFLRERLPVQRGASEHTSDSYAYSHQLLYQFASARLKMRPSELLLEHVDAALVMDFLEHLEYFSEGRLAMAMGYMSGVTII